MKRNVLIVVGLHGIPFPSLLRELRAEFRARRFLIGQTKKRARSDRRKRSGRFGEHDELLFSLLCTNTACIM